MIYTTIIHPLRKHLSLTPYEYMICDIIAKSQGNPSYSDQQGWCTISYPTIARYIGISIRGIKKSAATLKEKGLLESKGSGKQKRVTSKWFEAIETVNKIHSFPWGEQHAPVNIVHDKRELYSPLNVKDVHLKGVHRSPHNKLKEIKTNLKNKVYDLNVEEDSFSELASPNVKPESSKKTLLFKDCLYQNFEKFEQKMIQDHSDYDVIDLKHYHFALLDWNEIKTVKRTAKGWLATARTWIRNDARDQKVKMKNKLIHKNIKHEPKPIVDQEQIRRITNQQWEF